MSANLSQGVRMKRLLALLITLATPATLAAQQPSPQPSQGVITDVFRTRTLALQRNLAQAFDSIPERLFSYRPTPVQQSIGYVAQHLVTDNYLFCNGFGEMKGQRAVEDTTTADSIKATWPKERLMGQLRASFDFCERAFTQLSDAALADSVTMTFRGQARQLPRTSLVLGHIVDMADHYSQIANYMRLNNMVPPTALPRRQ